MNYEEAMVIVDAGGFVSRESYWRPVQAGFSWGVWTSRERRWTPDDLKRAREYDYTKDEPVMPTGEYYRANHTLCESWTHDPASFEKEATDWFDVSDQFENGWLKAHTEHLSQGEEKTHVPV